MPDFQTLYLIPITTAVVAAIAVVLFKRWYSKVCERQDRRDRVFYHTIREVRAQHHALNEVFTHMNGGTGEVYRRNYEAELTRLEKSEILL